VASDKKREIWHPPEYTDDDVRAIQAIALYAQSAVIPPKPGQEPAAPTPLDCKRALDWIINRACSTYESGFSPNDPNGRIGAFMEGRRFAGQQVVKLTKLRLNPTSRQYSEER
jgi:hypothetical protein